MKTFKIYMVFLSVLSLASCKFLDPEELSIVEGKDVFSNLNLIRNELTSVYSNLPAGYNDIGESWISGAADELEAVYQGESIQNMNIGNWGAYSNPDDRWSKNYAGIRKVADFLQGTDTVTWSGYQYADPVEYARRTSLMIQYRAEARFLRAYFYAELVMRYGGVPLVIGKLDANLNNELLMQAKRNTFEECINYIVTECDQAAAILPVNIAADQLISQDGRGTRGAALALKSRMLLYAASDLFNRSGNSNAFTGYTGGDRTERWIAAATAAKAVMNLNKYSLHSSYRNLFLLGALSSNEVIFQRRTPSANTFEALNYPIGYEQGKAANSPVGNLVDAYEMKDGSDFSWNIPAMKADPYANRDPRLKMSVISNDELWAKRKVEIWVGGADGLPKTRASKTGYYLKKFVADNLDFRNADRVAHQWIFFRYAEILLNYAEAMNEAYNSPTFKTGDLNVSAEEALNLVRRRADVQMPAITGKDYAQFKLKLERERRVELAFEGHRWWDLKRWMKGAVLAQPVTGVSVLKTAPDVFSYEPIEVEKRYFDESKMYLYPIPQSEINKTGGTIQQNPNWN